MSRPPRREGDVPPEEEDEHPDEQRRAFVREAPPGQEPHAQQRVPMRRAIAQTPLYGRIRTPLLPPLPGGQQQARESAPEISLMQNALREVIYLRGLVLREAEDEYQRLAQLGAESLQDARERQRQREQNERRRPRELEDEQEDLPPPPQQQDEDEDEEAEFLRLFPPQEAALGRGRGRGRPRGGGPARGRGRPRAQNAVRSANGQMVRAVRWCFTIFAERGWPPGWPPQRLPPGIVYMQFQLERGAFNQVNVTPEQLADQQGTHVQGYLEVDLSIYPNGITSDQLAQLLGIDPARLSYAAPAEMGRDRAGFYCNKQETRVDGPYLLEEQDPNVRRGDDMAYRGRDEDAPGRPRHPPPAVQQLGAPVRFRPFEAWQNIHDLARQGFTCEQITEMHPQIAGMYGTGVSRVCSMFNPNRTRMRNVKVYVLWGPTDTGKSHRVHHTFGAPAGRKMVTKASGAPTYHDIEEDTETYFFDEFDSNAQDCPTLTEMNKVCDKYPIRLNVKHGHKYAGYTNVVFCSNSDPYSWYPRSGQAYREAFFRRFTGVWYVTSRTQHLDGWPYPPNGWNESVVEEL